MRLNLLLSLLLVVGCSTHRVETLDETKKENSEVKVEDKSLTVVQQETDQGEHDEDLEIILYGADGGVKEVKKSHAHYAPSKTVTQAKKNEDVKGDGKVQKQEEEKWYKKLIRKPSFGFGVSAVALLVALGYLVWKGRKFFLGG